MKSLFTFFISIFTIAAYSQPVIVGKRIEAKDSLKVGTYQVSGISNDTSINYKRSGLLITEAAAKAYTDNITNNLTSLVNAKVSSQWSTNLDGSIYFDGNDPVVPDTSILNNNYIYQYVVDSILLLKNRMSDLTDSVNYYQHLIVYNDSIRQVLIDSMNALILQNTYDIQDRITLDYFDTLSENTNAILNAQRDSIIAHNLRLISNTTAVNNKIDKIPGGTAAQFIKANGTADATLYQPKVLTQSIATNASFTAVVNTRKKLPNGVLTANRTITFPSGSEYDIIEFWNRETTYQWLLSGAIAYSADEVAITSLAANTYYIFTYIDNKWIRKN